MDLRKIKKLIDLLNASAIGEIEVKSGEESVRISKHSSLGSTTTVIQPAETAEPVSEPPTPSNNAIEHAGYTQCSPMVGTAYLSSAPGAKPFVTTGQTIKEGDTLCIIEAMKVFNPIKAKHSGTIIACLIEDGQAIEFDEPLFVIDPTHSTAD